MKIKLLIVILPAISLAAQNGAGLRPNMAGPSSPAGCAGQGACPLASLSAGAPTTLSAVDLVTAFEQERLANELYRVAAEYWNLPVFANVAAAEGRHQEAIRQLAAAATVGLPPVQVGHYVDPDTQRLYDQLAALMTSSSAAALKAAALLEETTISELRRLQTPGTDSTSRLVLAQLERASRNHLAAFVRNLQSAGQSYQPQVLTPDEFSAALSSAGGPGYGRGYRGGAGCQSAACPM